jgi:hypothetical protein
MIHAIRQYWPWSTAAVWGGGAAVALAASSLSSGRRSGGDLLAATSNGLFLFCLVGGIGVPDEIRAAGDQSALRSVLGRPWMFAAVPAAATVTMLLPLRVAAIARGIEGPWSSLPESAADIGLRAAVVYVAVGFLASRRDMSATRGDR